VEAEVALGLAVACLLSLTVLRPGSIGLAAEKSTLIQGLAKAAETATAAGDFARAGDLYLEIWHADGTQQVALYNAARAHQLAGNLPTEAQWEMGARGDCVKNGKTAGDATCAQAMRQYPWGDTTADCTYAVMYNGTNGCGTNATWTVGSKTSGDCPYGLHDMAGNLWEWNRDWYAAYASIDQTDPAGPGSASGRVGRGGSFDEFAGSLRAGNRNDGNPSLAGSSLGLPPATPSRRSP